MVFDLHFLEFPDESYALAVAGFVFEQEDVILGGEDASAAVVVGVRFFAIDGQDWHSGGLGVGREESVDVHHGAERDVAQIGGCAMIADDAIRQHGEGMRVVAEEHA